MTADQIEALFHECLKRGDSKGVEASIRLMLSVDMRRGIELYDGLKLAIDIASVISGDTR